MRTLITVVWFIAVLASNARAQSADPPRFSVGDTWVRSNGIVLTVTRADDSETIIRGFYGAACPDCLVTVDKDFKPVAVTDAEGKALDAARLRGLPLGKGWKLFNWPLQTGKAWTTSGHLASRMGTPLAVSVDVRVLAFEEVTTQAGTFKAYRIEQAWRSVSSERTDGWINTFWYAPEVKANVKFEPNDARQVAWELVSYSLK